MKVPSSKFQVPSSQLRVQSPKSKVQSPKSTVPSSKFPVPGREEPGPPSLQVPNPKSHVSPTPDPRPPTPFPGPLYAIADTLGRPELLFVDLAEKICAGGARLLQLRVKEVPAREFLAIARAVRAICQQYGCVLIINDRADIALAVAADGVHLGQEDLPLEAARKVLGPDRLIGISTHDPAQALAAARDGADYIGFGPLFGTRTKATGYSARGLDQLREIRALVSLPIVAIGGITAERAPAALAAGADAVAMISDIVLAQDVSATVAGVLRDLAGR
ncbi:MAG: thiamine phosphate synthase [Candidatus Binatia bacterium]